MQEKVLLKKIYLYSLIDSCHNYYGSSVLSFFWIPGLLSGGFFFSKMFVDKFLKKYIVYYHPGLCTQTVIFLLGTILGPIVFVPAGLVLLVKAAINPVDKENYVSPKQKKFRIVIWHTFLEDGHKIKNFLRLTHY